MDTVAVPLAALIGGAAVVLIAVVMITLLLRSRRHQARRVAAAVVRLEEAPSLDTSGGIDRLLSKLEEGIDRVIVSRGDAATSTERLTQALHAVPHGVVVCTDDGEVVWRNAEADRIARGRHGDAVLDREVRELLGKTLATEAEQWHTVELFGPPRRVIELHTVPLEAGFRTGGAVAIIEDVSERRRVEAMRRDFVANISHELKTPVGALALLGETLAAEDDAQVMERLANRMQREARRVNRIIDDLLALSRIEAEEAPSRERHPVHLLVAEAVERVRPLADNKHITIEAPEPDPNLSVVCDRRQLVSAIFNLLENAVKYSERSETVTVHASQEGGRVAITVRDRGVGIPSRDLERIFERFYRVDRGRSRDTGGTGLGLAIVRHVAHNHHGEVMVESREGDGSAFTLRLPGLGGAAGTSEDPHVATGAR